MSGDPIDASVEQEYRRVIDERAIADVAVRYCLALDEKDWSALANVFTPDASADLLAPHTHVGLEAITERVRSALGPLDQTQHLVSNHQVWLDGDTARHRCYLHAQHVRRGVDGGPNFILAGRYEDELARTSVGWRITYRRLVMMWTDGNPAVAQV